MLTAASNETWVGSWNIDTDEWSIARVCSVCRAIWEDVEPTGKLCPECWRWVD